MPLTEPLSQRTRALWWAIFLIVLAISVFVRIRFLALPLERDEGEYAYAGQLMLRGIAPYQLAYNMKFPGTYVAYALMIALFGQSAIGIHFGYLLMNLATIAVVILIGRALFNIVAGLVAGAVYAALSINPSVLGLSAHATHFVVLPALLGCFILLSAKLTRIRLFLAGLFFGLSLMMKQPGLFFGLFGLSWLFYSQWKNRTAWKTRIGELSTYLAGVALPFLVTCAALYCAGTFSNFWFWTIRYAADYGTVVSPSLGAYIFARNFLRALDHLWLVWLIAGIGLGSLLFARQFRRQLFFLVGLFICSALALGAGLYFRPHYFVLVLPIVALLAGASVVIFPKVVLRAAPFVLLVGCMLPFVIERQFFFSLSPTQVCRRLYGANPFPEAPQVADFIRSRTTAQDKIAIIGSEPEIYFYVQRLSATGYIYMYPAMEPQPLALQMQRQIITEIERAAPKVIVVIGVDMSWKWPVEGTVLQDWAERYVAQNYRPIGLVNIISLSTTDYYLPLTTQSAPVGSNYLIIYERL